MVLAGLRGLHLAFGEMSRSPRCMLRVGLGARTVAACWTSRDSGEWEEGRFEHARAQEHVCSGRGGGTPRGDHFCTLPARSPWLSTPTACHHLPPLLVTVKSISLLLKEIKMKPFRGSYCMGGPATLCPSYRTQKATPPPPPSPRREQGPEPEGWRVGDTPAQARPARAGLASLAVRQRQV